MSILLEYRVCAVLQVTNGGDLQLARSGEGTRIAKNSPPFYAVGKGGDPNGLSSSKICLRTWLSSIRKISPQSKFQKKPPVFEAGGIHQGASTYSFLPIDSGSIRTKWEKEQMGKRVPRKQRAGEEI